MRRYDEPPKPEQYYKHRPGAYGIFTHPKGLLLTAQIGETVEWQLPGGGIEADESPIQALTREAYEETGWRVQVERKVGMYKRFVYMPEYKIHAEKICHIYAGRAIMQMGNPTEADHFSACFSYEIAAEILVNQGDRDLLTHWLQAH